MDFELLKTKISRYKLSSLVRSSFVILDDSQRTKQKTYPFWNLLVVIKWALIHTDENQFKLEATPRDVAEILSLTETFAEKDPVVSFKTVEGLNRGMRVLAFQHFWTQDFIGNHVFDRQLILYGSAGSSPTINDSFRELTRFDIPEFISLCYYTFIYLNKDVLVDKFQYEGVLYEDYYEVLSNIFPPQKIKQFIDLLTLKDVNEIQSLQKMSNEKHQLYETNFLTTKPFVQYDGYARTFHRSVFGQTCKHFIYDFMKAKSPGFSEFFGKRLEKYLELGLSEIQIPFDNENTLLRKYPLTKVTDFVVDDYLLVESKAIELHPRAAVLRYQTLLSSSLNDSIVKAYCQMLSTAFTIDPQRTWYGIVVTYKEMYLGFGPDAWEEFLKGPVLEFAQANNIEVSKILPPENVCFIDVDCWDMLIQVVKDKVGTFRNVLETATEMNASFATRRLMLEQVLKERFPVKRINLDYLNNAHQLIPNLSAT